MLTILKVKNAFLKYIKSNTSNEEYLKAKERINSIKFEYAKAYKTLYVKMPGTRKKILAGQENEDILGITGIWNAKISENVVTVRKCFIFKRNIGYNKKLFKITVIHEILHQLSDNIININENYIERHRGFDVLKLERKYDNNYEIVKGYKYECIEESIVSMLAIKIYNEIYKDNVDPKEYMREDFFKVEKLFTRVNSMIFQNPNEIYKYFFNNRRKEYEELLLEKLNITLEILDLYLQIYAEYRSYNKKLREELSKWIKKIGSD